MHAIAGGDEGYFEPYGCNGTGFQTMTCAMMALFQILIQANWSDAMNSVIQTVGYPAAIFFILFFITVCGPFCLMLLLITPTPMCPYLSSTRPI